MDSGRWLPRVAEAGGWLNWGLSGSSFYSEQWVPGGFLRY